ncbi:hypothetical protein ACQEU3_22025 [Spirillospora sp. CA-253888]
MNDFPEEIQFESREEADAHARMVGDRLLSILEAAGYSLRDEKGASVAFCSGEKDLLSWAVRGRIRDERSGGEG